MKFRDFKFVIGDILQEFLPVVFKLKPLNDNALAQWLNALLYPISVLHDTVFASFKDDCAYRLSHTGQVGSIEHLLNSIIGSPYSLDPNTSNDIYIEDGNDIDINFIHTSEELYQVPEEERMHLYPTSNDSPVYIYTNSENANVISFYVYVPDYVYSLKRKEITQALEAYKVAGFSYEFKTY